MPVNFLEVCDLNAKALHALFERAQKLEAAFHAHAMPPLLRGKKIALLFEDSGFRNRVAFELGIRLMGGEAIFVPGRPGEREPAADIAQYLSNWFDAIVIRTPTYKIVKEIAGAARVPVINARTCHNHPCEILGDLAFVRKNRGSLDGLKVVFVGEPTNLCHSWFEAGTALSLEIIQVCPEGYEIDRVFLESLKQKAIGSLQISHDLRATLQDADVVYTDCWPHRGTAQDREIIAQAFSPYRITAELLEQTPATCAFLPCPPVTRGEEVSTDAMTSQRCRVYEAKDYLLHAQNALLVTLITEMENQAR